MSCHVDLMIPGMTVRMRKLAISMTETKNFVCEKILYVETVLFDLILRSDRKYVWKMFAYVMVANIR